MFSIIIMINLYTFTIEVLCATDPIAIGSPNAQGRHSKIPASGIIKFDEVLF